MRCIQPLWSTFVVFSMFAASAQSTLLGQDAPRNFFQTTVLAKGSNVEFNPPMPIPIARVEAAGLQYALSGDSISLSDESRRILFSQRLPAQPKNPLASDSVIRLLRSACKVRVFREDSPGGNSLSGSTGVFFVVPEELQHLKAAQQEHEQLILTSGHLIHQVETDEATSSEPSGYLYVSRVVNGALVHYPATVVCSELSADSDYLILRIETNERIASLDVANTTPRFTETSSLVSVRHHPNDSFNSMICYSVLQKFKVGEGSMFAITQSPSFERGDSGSAQVDPHTMEIVSIATAITTQSVMLSVGAGLEQDLKFCQGSVGYSLEVYPMLVRANKKLSELSVQNDAD